MRKRCICIALVLILVTTIGLAPLAQPAEAVAGVVVAGAVVAVMAMAGITIITSGMTAAQIQDWVEDKLEEWASDVGSPLDHLINSAGIGVTISGLLTIGTAAAQGISDFITWLKTELSLTDNSQELVYEKTTTYGDIPVYYGDHVNLAPSWGGTQYTARYNGSTVNVCWVRQYYNSLYSLIAISDTPFTINFSMNATNVSDNYYVLYLSDGRDVPFVPVLPTYNGSVYDYLTAHPGLSVDDDSGSLTIGTGVIAIPQVQQDEKVFVDVGAAPGSTVSEVTEGVFTDVSDDTLDVSGTVAEEEPEYVITGPVSVSGLDDIFPFCIPFDLYHMLEALAADPVAPYFEWRFYVPRIVDYTLVIDLSGFNTVAQILRIMETLLFCVGLAFETRKLIRS